MFIQKYGVNCLRSFAMKWEATQKAWRCLFPLIIILECFLHAFTKIREYGKHLKETFQRISLKVWQVYHAIDANAFRMQASELLSWPESNMTDYVLEAVRKRKLKTLYKGRLLCLGL